MGLAKKGSHTISINGSDYRWVVSPDSGYIKLVVEYETTPGQRLIATFDYGDDAHTGKQARSITPATVRDTIYLGLARGWQPTERGLAPFRILDADETIPLSHGAT